MDGKAILDLPMQENDAGAKTVRDYLLMLLKTLWREQDGFSGKRPFGNSGWDYDLYTALVKGKAIKGSFYEYDDGYSELEHCDEGAGAKAIFRAIEALRGYIRA